jgi:hypothetical protein
MHKVKIKQKIYICFFDIVKVTYKRVGSGPTLKLSDTGPRIQIGAGSDSLRRTGSTAPFVANLIWIRRD